MGRARNNDRSREESRARTGFGRTCVMAVLASACAFVGPGCAPDFDTNRTTLERGSLGREMYTMLCDRVGAQALREDIAGLSYRNVCHADERGAFVDQVDVQKLPALVPAVDVDGHPVSVATQQANREHRIARIEALARRRGDLVDALDRALTNEKVGLKDLDDADDARSCDPPSGDGPAQEDVAKALADTLGRFTDLYQDDTIAHLTRALARTMADIEASPDAQTALAQLDGREGYRPESVELGALRPLLSYPRLAPLSSALLRLLSSDTDPLGMTLPPGAPRKPARERTSADRIPGTANEPFVKMLAVLREELRTSQPIADLPPLRVATNARDPRLVELSRPRGNLELVREILLARDPAFSVQAPRYVVARDGRGFANVVAPGGSVPPPFVDATGPEGMPDGLPDVDDLGRFVTKDGLAPFPFPVTGRDDGATRDADGRALLGGEPAYAYIDVDGTYLAALSRDLVPLLDSDPSHAHESLMGLLAGFVVVAGRRQDEADALRSYDGGSTIAYRAFREDDSPILDLVYALGQVLADPTTDDTLALFERLLRDKPGMVARLLGVSLRIKEIADAHPEAKIPASSTLWDELLDVVAAMAQKPALIEDLLRAFGDQRTVDLAKSGALYMSMRDRISYDRNDIDARINQTTGKRETLVTPVNRALPDTGLNRSAFQRFLQTLHDTNGMSSCTKPGAVAHVVWKGLPLDFPSPAANAACLLLGANLPADPMPRCGMFRLENVAADIVDAVLGKVKLDVRDDCLRVLIDSPLTGIVGGTDAFLEEVSGIHGWNTHPTVAGINRMIFFDQPHDGQLGDLRNPKTLNFFQDLFDPAETLVCPALAFTDTDGRTLNLRRCSSFADSLRGRDADALFPLEEAGFLASAVPLAEAFAKNDANLLFVQLLDVLHLHWGSPAQSHDECDPSLPRSDARWCSGDGAVSYEPLVAEALETDLFQALHDSVAELAIVTVPHCDARDANGGCTKTVTWDGITVLANAIEALVDPTRNGGLLRRNGERSVTRNDGATNEQVTPIYLLLDALTGFDRRLAEHAAKSPDDDRKARWKRGRSQLVDQLLTVHGAGKDARLANVAVEKILPVVVSTLRAQLAAHCADPSKGCAWARTELTKKLRDVVTGPTFATTLDLVDAILADEGARSELERLLAHLLGEERDDAAVATRTTLVDMLQIFEDDGRVTALLHALAGMAGPEVLDDDGRVKERGFVLAAVELLARVLGEVHDANGNRICKKEIDPNGALSVVLRRLVTPPESGGRSPIDVLIDVAADVNRRHPETVTKLEADDYASIAEEVADFCTNESRGLEQVYAVIKEATKDP